MKESDIAYESANYFVVTVAKGYEVYHKGTTHSTRCAVIGFEGKRGLDRAIEECGRRENDRRKLLDARQ